MSQGGYVTLVGFVAREPRLREIKDGRHVTEVRVGTTTRVLNKATGEWHDGDTSYFNVNCWRRLADHVNASLHKGDPVVVKGRFKTRSYEDKAGRLRTEVEIVADTVGHDLNRGVANYLRQHHPRPEGAGDRPADESMESVDVAEDIEIIDEEAIEQFGRELDEDLDEAARTLGNDPDRDAQDALGTQDIRESQDAAPPVPQVPF